MTRVDAASAFVIALWLPYLALNTMFPGPALTYGLGIIIAAAALTALRLAGVRSDELSLQPAPLSREGALLLFAVLAALPLAVLVGRGQPLEWLGAFAYAPASALAQELYFRCAMISALDRLSPGRDGVLRRRCSSRSGMRAPSARSRRDRRCSCCWGRSWRRWRGAGRCAATARSSMR